MTVNVLLTPKVFLILVQGCYMYITRSAGRATNPKVIVSICFIFCWSLMLYKIVKTISQKKGDVTLCSITFLIQRVVPLGIFLVYYPVPRVTRHIQFSTCADLGGGDRGGRGIRTPPPWNFQSLISPILLEMKKIVIFKIFACTSKFILKTDSILLKVGPPPP